MTQNNLLVSVIIPTYNRYDFLLKSVESVYNQSYDNMEIIIIDDGSTDKTYLIKDKFPELIYIFQNNSGVASARNKGINISTGKYIAFLDSDDLWLKDKILKEVEFLNKNENLDLVHTDEKWIRNGMFINQKKIHKKEGGDLFYRSLQLCLISPSSVMIRKELFNKVGLFDESLPVAEDYDLWLRITSLVNIGYINEKLVIKQGGHSDQLSTSTFAIDRYRIISINKLINSNVLSDNQQESAIKEIRKKCLILFNGAIKHNNKELQDFCNIHCRKYL